MTSSSTRKHVLDATVLVYSKLGPKFTMNDLAKELGMSKKTIYTIFQDKESLLYAMVDYFFDSVKESEESAARVVEGETCTKRLKGIMSAMPDMYREVDFTQLYILQEKYPAVYKRIRERLESGWESTLSVIDEGVESGEFRPVNKLVFQLTFEAAIERFLVGDELQQNKLEYAKALDELVDIMVEGIRAR